jgi:hypothetical protein
MVQRWKKHVSSTRSQFALIILCMCMCGCGCFEVTACGCLFLSAHLHGQCTWWCAYNWIHLPSIHSDKLACVQTDLSMRMRMYVRTLPICTHIFALISHIGNTVSGCDMSDCDLQGKKYDSNESAQLSKELCTEIVCIQPLCMHFFMFMNAYHSVFVCLCMCQSWAFLDNLVFRETKS